MSRTYHELSESDLDALDAARSRLVLAQEATARAADSLERMSSRMAKSAGAPAGSRVGVYPLGIYWDKPEGGDS